MFNFKNIKMKKVSVVFVMLSISLDNDVADTTAVEFSFFPNIMH